MLSVPVVFAPRADEPTAVFPLPVVFVLRADEPTAVSNTPVVLASKKQNQLQYY